MTDSGKTSRFNPQSILGFVISAVALGFFLWWVDISSVISALKNGDYIYLIPALIGFAGTLLCRAWAWRVQLKKKPSLSQTFWTINQGYLINNFFPLRLGEVARAFLLELKSEVPFWQGAASIIIERIFDLAIAVSLILFSVPFVVGSDLAAQTAIGMGIALIVGFTLLFLAAKFPEYFLNLFLRLTRPWEKLSSWGETRLKQIFEGLNVLADGRRFLQVLFWMLMTWAFNIFFHAGLLRVFVADITWIQVIFVLGVASMGVAVPAAPGAVGTLEVAIIWALGLIAIDTDLAAAFALTTHAMYFLVTSILGMIAVTRDGFSLGEMIKNLRARNQQETNQPKNLS